MPTLEYSGFGSAEYLTGHGPRGVLRVERPGTCFATELREDDREKKAREGVCTCATYHVFNFIFGT
jgi:hypothetical protein